MFRREFFPAFPSFIFSSASGRKRKRKKSLIVHQTLFWLKDPKSQEKKTMLIENLRTLTKIEFHRTLIGVPIQTPKFEGTDSSYDVSIVTYFNNADGRVTYQNHPVHQAFLSNNRDLWERSVSYDTFCEIP